MYIFCIEDDNKKRSIVLSIHANDYIKYNRVAIIHTSFITKKDAEKFIHSQPFFSAWLAGKNVNLNEELIKVAYAGYILSPIIERSIK